MTKKLCSDTVQNGRTALKMTWSKVKLCFLLSKIKIDFEISTSKNQSLFSISATCIIETDCSVPLALAVSWVTKIYDDLL